MIYFDNSATTKPHKEVLDSFYKVSAEYFGNPSSLHQFGGQSERLLFQAREQIAGLLKVKTNEIYFTSGGTESNNIAIKGTALLHKNRGKHIITTEIEHSSVKESVEQLTKFGYRITYIPVDHNGIVKVNEIEKAITDDTILVSVMHVNNEIGSIQPIEKIGKMLRPYSKILFHVDYVQGIGKVPLSIHDSYIDLCSISGHKFHGLKGTGALFIRKGAGITPLLSGGGQEWGYRSGTENVAGIVAMAKALRLIDHHKEKNLPEMMKINEFLRKELEMINGVTIHSPIRQAAPHIINFSLKGIKAEVFVHALEKYNIYVSTTSACSSKRQKASRTLLAMGVAEDEALSAIRISLSYENTMHEAKQFIEAVLKIVKELRKVMK